MLAVAQAQDLIEKAKIDGVDKVYVFNIPSEQVSNTDQTIVLIQDANTNPAVFGDNDFYGLDRQVEIQVFYKDQLDVDPETIETKLYKLFVHHGWELGQNHGHLRDNDTGQLYTTFYVQNLELI